jgi:hypothetical protein
MSYIKEACISIAQRRSPMARRKAPPRKEPDDGDGGWLRPKEMGLFKDPEQVMREAHRAEAFEAKMEASRQLLEERHLAKERCGGAEASHGIA